MPKNEKDWIREFESIGAIWFYDKNDPQKPHALLTSGLHSNGFVNSERMMENPALLDEACYHLMSRLPKDELIIINRVVGPAMGAISVAHDMARNISHKRGHACLRSYAEREGSEFRFSRTSVDVGENILIVEDVLTTGGSIERVIQAVTNSGGYPLPFVAVLVNRGALKKVAGLEIIALINRPISTWDPEKEECPLCKAGSKALRPKENWSKFVEGRIRRVRRQLSD